MYIFWHIISRVCKWSWLTINFVREFISNILLFLFIFFCVSLYFQIKHSNDPIKIKKGALKLNLIGYVSEKTNFNHEFKKISRNVLHVNTNKVKEISLFDIVYAIRQARDDKNITGIVLELDNFFGADHAALEYIGKALREVRHAGKPIYAIGSSYTQSQYYLASFANYIYMNPIGMLDVYGLSTHRLYYKTFLEKFKITPHIFRVGTYKSAVEPLMRDNMSEQSRHMEQNLMNTLWNNYLHTVSINRNVNVKTLFPPAKEFLEELKKLKGDYAEYAKKHALIDYVASHYVVQRQLAKIFGFNKSKKEYNYTSIYDYPLKHEKKSNKNKIAVIVVEGTITDGENEPGIVSSYTTARQIKSARLDKNIKAIIFRINSPGGGVHASEVIREELLEVQKQKKPIVISMGSVAASGGYWIATPGNYIIASANTITGSIGIFSVFNTFEKFINQLGIHADSVSTSPFADLFYAKKLPKEIEKLIQLTIEHGYNQFINLVSETRKQPIKNIEDIAQGLIWVGHEALEKKLIDSVGDFDDAVSKAIELAKLKDYHLCWIEESASIFEVIVYHLHKFIKVFIPKQMHSRNLYFELYQDIEKNFIPLSFFKDPLNQYAFCLNCYVMTKDKKIEF